MTGTDRYPVPPDPGNSWIYVPPFKERVPDWLYTYLRLLHPAWTPQLTHYPREVTEWKLYAIVFNGKVNGKAITQRVYMN